MIANILDVVVVLLPGLTVLGGLAWLIGKLDADAQKSALRRLAVARSQVRDQERDLPSSAGTARCRDCPADGYRR